MKRSLYYFFMLLAIVAMPLTSCEKEPQKSGEEKQHDPKSDEDQIEISGYDGLEYFQNSIVVVDKAGNVVRRVCGKPLDESLPDVISIPVKDKEMAEEIFLSWVAPEKKATSVIGGYDYNLTDSDGNPQGSVSFRNADGSDGVLATLTIGENTDLKCFTQINFVSDQAWPDNSDNAKYETGKTYVISAEALKMDVCPAQPDPNSDMVLSCMMPYTADLTFYCIQGNTGGKEAILVYLSPDVDDFHEHGNPIHYVEWNAYKHCASLPEAEKVLKYYTENYHFWEAMIDYMERLGHVWDWHYGVATTGNEEFILNSYNKNAGTIKVLDLDRKEGKIIDVDVDSWFQYRYIYVRTFPPYIGE